VITLKRLAVGNYKGISALDLTFPERGSILIEGRNEAGKSTLFDAVHYALYGGPMVGDLASALHYGAEQMEVRLDLAVSGTELAVWRRTRLTAKSQRSEATLSVARPGGPDGVAGEVEQVKGAGPVTARLQLELGGLTSEALLNSCLVAQKQLGRLETLTRASREEALTVLLNLGKLTEVQNRLRPRGQHEEALRTAQARVVLARAQESLNDLATRREALERRRDLVRLRDGIDRLEGLHTRVVRARETLAAQGERLEALRATLARAETLKAAASRWQRVQDVAGQGESALRERDLAAARVAEAQRAGAALPAARAALARMRQARDDAEALAADQARMRELAQEGERLDARLNERSAVADRAARLESLLDDLRRQRRDVATSLNQLAPLLTEQEGLGVRLAGLEALQARGAELARLRGELEALEEQAVARVEADARQEGAARLLAEAQADLEAVAGRRRRRDVTRALHRWRGAHRAAAAAARARRLLEDLALAVAGVDHVGVPGAGDAGPAPGEGGLGDHALRLSLIVDHPLTGSQMVRLRLWAGGAELLEARPASAAETSGLEAGNLPRLSAAGDAAPIAELDAAGDALLELGEPVPADEDDVARRLEALTGARGAPESAGHDGRADGDADEAYLQARAAVIAATSRLEEAEIARRGLADVVTLRRREAVARRELDGVERACLQDGRALSLAGPDADAVLCAVPATIATAQQRFRELAEQTAQRSALQARLRDVEGNGKEYARQLEECRGDLSRDDEAALHARRVSLDVERESVAAAAVKLYAGAVAVAREGEGANGAVADGVAGGDGAATGVLVADALPDALPDATGLRSALRRRCDALQGEVAVLERQAAAGDEAAAGLSAAAERLTRLGRDLAAALVAAGGPDGAGAEAETGGGEPAPLDGPAARAAQSLGRRRGAEIAAELAALDEPAARADEQAVQRLAWAAEDELRTSGEEGGRLAAGLLDLAAETGHHLADAPGAAPDEEAPEAPEAPEALDRTVARLRRACPDAAGDLPALEETDAQLATLQQEAWAAERAAVEARVLLGDEAPLPPAEAATALAETELDLAARRRTQDILGQTRQRMINKVLPDTMRNMCLLLPLLTAGRYRYAELTPDYRLQVWDERKHGYVEKSLYSGGTQDQFSLALRLGFALAALPRELGTSPGFLFLDEPLSSFDHDRTAALIDLLTHGQIATFFQQVFLISHSQAFDPSRFSHHIVMEEGGVAHSTLHRAPGDASGAPGEALAVQSQP
jgi:DNA repair exonuclease SbcCD ATPase subunit